MGRINKYRTHLVSDERDEPNYGASNFPDPSLRTGKIQIRNIVAFLLKELRVEEIVRDGGRRFPDAQEIVEIRWLIFPDQWNRIPYTPPIP